MLKKEYSLPELEKIAQKIRFELIQMAHFGTAAHVGSSLSCVDLLVSLYFSFLQIDPKNPKNRLRDRFILSKGHAISALYATLAYRGFFPISLLKTFNQDGSSLPEHPSPFCIPGLEAATGSLGHGLSIGLGHALSGKILHENYKVVVLLSDGECNEGSIWEAALFAPKKKLQNIIAIIDFNKWQATNRSCDVMQLMPLKEKWLSFGWEVFEINGHNIQEIQQTLYHLPYKKPTLIIANTIKGKGISFMEDDNNWHYKIPTYEEVLQAKKELNLP